MGKGRGIAWTEEEDQLLREMIAANASNTLMRARLKRSPEAIRMRILKLQKRLETQADSRRVPPLEMGTRFVLGNYQTIVQAREIGPSNIQRLIKCL